MIVRQRLEHDKEIHGAVIDELKDWTYFAWDERITLAISSLWRVLGEGLTDRNAIANPMIESIEKEMGREEIMELRHIMGYLIEKIWPSGYTRTVIGA
jgi:hypothetical protein